MAQSLGQLTAETGAQVDTDTNHLSLDGKTPRGKGMEIPDQGNRISKVFD